MNDERFDRDLGTVLREIAGEEAPMSLRNRLAHIADEAPVGRRLWFSPPMRLATAGVAVVAVLALAILLLPRDSIGPSPNGSAEPSAHASTSLEPSASAEPTVEPTPVPTPVIVTWTDLNWSAAFTPFAPNTSWIADIVPWGDGYVGVGGTFGASGPESGTIFSSGNGLRWTVVQQVDLPFDWTFAHVVRLGDGLLAVSDQRGVPCEGSGPCPPEGFDIAPRLWQSADGLTWTPIDSQSWRDVLGDAVPLWWTGGDDGVLAVMYDGTVIHSSDGQTWRRTPLPAAEKAIPSDLTVFAGGFVVVGRDGQRDPVSQVTPASPSPGVGRPAAWVSSDGIDWTEAVVEGESVAGGELRSVAAGANGLFATGIAEAVGVQAHRATHGWTSLDGRSWTLAGSLGTDLPDSELLVGDGTRMLVLGADAPGSASLAASVSSDGLTWIRLPFSGETTDLPQIRYQSSPESGTYLFRAWFGHDGILVQATGAVAQQFWFASALASSAVQ